MPTARLFVNPVLERRRRQRGALDRISAILSDSGLTLQVEETLSARSAGDQAREAVESGVDMIYVCGGDGTVFDVVQGVAGSDVPVGVLPFGTGNVLAQNLGLSFNPVRAARSLVRGSPRRVCLGRITCTPIGHSRERSWFFTIAAGLGGHALLMRTAERYGKRFSGRSAYYFAGAELLLRHRITSFAVEITPAVGPRIHGHACEAIAARVPALNRWHPGGQLDQPLLRLATLDAETRMGLAEASFFAISRLSTTVNGRPRAHYTDATRVRCSPLPGYTYEQPVLVQADGEILGASTAEITVARESLTLLWPE